MLLRGLVNCAAKVVMPDRKTAAILVIGDEILKGQTIDTNSSFIARRLHSIGVNLRKISVVGDSINDIGEEILRLSDRHDVVFTTGGIGPTHDDKTYIALAQAFGTKLALSEDMNRVVTEFLPPSLAGVDSSTILSKLCTVPEKCDLLRVASSSFPVVKIKNVVILPGVPRFCEKAFIGLQSQLFPEAQPLFAHTVYTKRDEFRFSDALSRLAARFDGKVEIGSYPVVNNGFFKTKLNIESESVEMGKEAVAEVNELLGNDIVYYDENPSENTVEKLQAFIDRQKDPKFIAKIVEAQKIIADIVDQYSLKEIALSFNGGKDCTVLLHLLRVAIDKKYGPGTIIQGFHIMCEDQFPEATQFIIDVAKIYNITVLEFPGPLKTGLELMKKQRPDVTAVLMGSRSTDPKGRYMNSPIEWTDSDWPRVLRVCPILHWSYTDVWSILRGLCISYCSLYDQGYTSLGGRDTTVKNPLLRTAGQNGKEKYLPAYMLENDGAERSGRASI